jgi:hypothetical protein
MTIFAVLLVLLSEVETDTFTPFPSGYSVLQQNSVSLVTAGSNEGFFSAAPGAPLLPLAARVFILPGNCEVVSVSASLDYPASEHRLSLPLAAAPVVQSVGESNSSGLTATTQSIAFGNPLVSVHTGHILSAYTIVSCSVNPWIYDAGTRELGLSPFCSIQLGWENSGRQYPVSDLQTEMVNFRAEALAERYGTVPVQSILPAGTRAEVDYLIITGENFTGEVTIMEDLLNSRGLSFLTLTVEEINGNWEGIDVQEDIRNCIKHYSENSGTAFVLLAGDETVVPVREVYTECEGMIEFAPSDLYYADLNGSWDANGNGIYGEDEDSLDLYADVMLGRLLFSTRESAAAVFQKNTAYADVGSSLPWVKKVVLCAAILFPEIGYTGVKGCELMTRQFPPDFDLTRAYQITSGDYPDTYFPVLYDGAGWNHYAGHGNDRGVYWAGTGTAMINISRMNGFNNPGRTGIHSSIACHTGDFTDPGVCLADTLLTLPSGGGVAVFFNTSWGWEGYWPEIGSSERLCLNTVAQVYQQKASTLGLAYTAAKDLEIPLMTGPYDRVMQSVLAYSAFMDPSLEVQGISDSEPFPPSRFQVVMLSTNPMYSGDAAFRVTGQSSFYDVTVYNIAGRAVTESFTIPQNAVSTIATGSLNTGVYFVSARAPGGATASGSFLLLK